RPNISLELSGKIRIVFPGNMDPEKGLDIIKGLLTRDVDRKFEIHILGNCSEIFDDDRVIQHGSYLREEFIDYIEKINPHLGAVLSIWDETWCHTLTELWAAGVQIGRAHV